MRWSLAKGFLLLGCLVVGGALAQDAKLLEPLPGARPDEFLVHVGDYAPALSLRAYNEDVAVRLVKSPLVSLHQFVGLRPEVPKQIVLLGFFATWNEKSRSDLAVFQRIYKKFDDEGVVVLMVSLDSKDTQSVYETIEQQKLTFPVLRDRFGVVSHRYGVNKLPTLFIIDKEGRVSSVGEGYSEDIESYLDKEIRTLLSGA